MFFSILQPKRFEGVNARGLVRCMGWNSDRQYKYQMGFSCVCLDISDLIALRQDPGVKCLRLGHAGGSKRVHIRG